ncbi:MAG: peptidoglycan-binding protein [Paracoccaceae bacterium]|nr:MAG: peptidoglycan-binding protein [Paracoccaceae bacterium]
MRLSRLVACIAIVLSLTLLLPVTARAQTAPLFWVQIEAQPGLADAETRARAWAQVFPDVAGFRMASGWYAISLGPYTREGAAERLATLRADNLIPGDSFLAGGEVYRAAFWPVGGQPPAAPVEVPAAPPPATGPVVVAPLPEPGAAPAPEVAAPVVPPEETLAEARAAEGRLNREERQAIQSALQWAGFYTSAIDGAFGPGTRGSITAWQTARGVEATGYLTTRQRETLLGERAALESALGLSSVAEPEAGIEISLPLRHVAFDGYAPPFVNYAERGDSGLRVVLISQPGDAGSLRGLYDLLQSLEVVPMQGARALSDRSFSIEAANERVASQTYAELSQGLIKGWMLIWEPQAADLAAQVLPLMKASFKATGRRALDPNLVPLDGGTQAAMLAGMEVRRPALSRSGFYVSSTGDVATTTDALQGCARLTIDRTTEARVAFADAALGLAVLTPAAPLAPPAVAALSAQSPRPGGEVALAGYSYEDALPAPALTFGSLAQATGLNGEADLRRLAIAALPGDAGGPVLDGSGAVLGMLLPGDGDAARQLPPGVTFALSAERIAARLAEAGVATLAAIAGGALSPEDLTQRATRMTVLVSCWK